MKISKIATICWKAKPKIRLWTAFVSHINERKYEYRISFIPIQRITTENRSVEPAEKLLFQKYF